MNSNKVSQTPLPAMFLRRLLALPARFILWVWGWKIKGPSPTHIPKHVLIGGFHTANIDGVLTVVVALALGYRLNFMMKDTMFRGPLPPIFRFFGGIPIDRTRSHNTVDQMAQAFKTHERLAIAISPEGTRKKTDYWRSGFYYIAYEAGVPIVMAVADFGRKEVRFSEPWMPSGDLESDTPHIQAFFEGSTPAEPDRATAIRFKPASHQPSNPPLPEE